MLETKEFYKEMISGIYCLKEAAICDVISELLTGKFLNDSMARKRENDYGK